jgi:hypothetical protein
MARRYGRGPDDPAFHRSVVALRRSGRRVYRVDRTHSRIDGKRVLNRVVTSRAKRLPVQLDLFAPPT